MTDTKVINFTGIDVYQEGIQAIINKEYRKAFDCFAQFYDLKGSTDEHYIKLADAYMENLATVVTTLEMIKEDTDKDPLYQRATSKHV